MSDEEWKVTGFPRVTAQQEEQVLDYPARVAECPQGHRRLIPLKFDGDSVELTCRDCGRSYRLSAPDR